MDDDTLNELAREIAGDIVRAQGEAALTGNRCDSSEMVNVVKSTLRLYRERQSAVEAKQDESDITWAMDRLKTIATTAETLHQVKACQAIVESMCAMAGIR